MRLNLRRLLIPALSTVVMLAVLIGLGTWQVKRLFWKQALLAQIARAEAQPPVPLPAQPSPFEKVVVSGHFRPDLAAQYGAEVRETPTGTEMGTHLLVPLQRDSGPDLLVDRGWVPTKRTAPIDQPADTVSVVGFIRPPDSAGWFSAPDDPVTRQFYTLDPTRIGAALGVPVAPYTLIAMDPSVPAGHWPIPAGHLPRPPNNHFSYVLTWYGLALALIGVFAVWVRQRPKP